MLVYGCYCCKLWLSLPDQILLNDYFKLVLCFFNLEYALLSCVYPSTIHRTNTSELPKYYFMFLQLCQVILKATGDFLNTSLTRPHKCLCSSPELVIWNVRYLLFYSFELPLTDYNWPSWSDEVSLNQKTYLWSIRDSFTNPVPVLLLTDFLR